ncbi:MAG: hypothetical protein VX699_11575 [Myxococcota bacterium]|nr:hypothetical protein [Myxococcota bacterium]
MEITTEFITYHRSGKDLHLRTTSQFIFISKEDSDMIQLAVSLQRGQKIRVVGEQEMSSTISAMVLKASTLELV